MEATAVARYLRISPFKARQVVDLIRGKSTREALAILRYTNKKGAPLIAKVIKSAVANAEHNFDMNADELYVAAAYVDEGPSLKRLKPRAYGRADMMKRRTSHITVVVKEREAR
ncbi:MAG: 50S ribosomal protein L22 [Syntrophomonadaceae bacterium]|nr:50S ribosomal protein L22 [Syntrophomonadaceae bacterium]